ncbi:E3 ubiquitin-protein ligase TRIM71-like [Onthophagus taurus]|uniref:E3 ubiquitin-protein ligase TRIM71-like n=1 Tax=Onthophagus taurus TaxID=166361 RepID=UPI0039BE0222
MSKNYQSKILSIQSLSTMDSYILDKRHFHMCERSSICSDEYKSQLEMQDSDSAISSEEEQFIPTSKLQFSKNTIVGCLQKSIYGNGTGNSIFRQLSLACSDHSCVFKINPDALNNLIWGNFVEENGLTIDVKDNFDDHQRKEINKKSNKTENDFNFGVIGDRGSGNYLKITSSEKNIVETETLARITWDVSKRCTIHKEPLYFICEKCERTICSKCIIENHQGHRITPKNTESVFTTAKKVQLSLNNYIKDIENLLFQIEITLKEIPYKAKETSESVIQLLNSWEYNGSCPHRRPYLLKLIETIKTLKVKDLKMQQYNLNQLLFRMESNLKSLRQSLITKNAKIINYSSLACREDLNLAKKYDYGFIPIHNKEFRITIKNNVFKKPAGLSIVGTTMVESMKKIALKKIPFDDSERYRDLSIDNFCYFKINFLNEFKDCYWFGEEGKEKGQVCRPWGIICDKTGRFFISDRSNNRIQIFNRNGKFEFSFGKYGKLKGELNRPAGIVIDNLNRLIVADKDNHRIQIFNLNGDYIQDFGKMGHLPGEFNYPWDVCTNLNNGEIIVSDTKNRRVQIFNKNCILNGVIDFYPYDLKFFDLPRAVHFNPNGELVIGDFNNHRFLIFDQIFSSFKLHGSDGQFNRPQGLIIDLDGNHIVADSKNGRVVIFDQHFKTIKEIKNETFKNPQGVCLTPEGNIAVIDMEYNRIVVL